MSETNSPSTTNPVNLPPSVLKLPTVSPITLNIKNFVTVESTYDDYLTWKKVFSQHFAIWNECNEVAQSWIIATLSRPYPTFSEIQPLLLSKEDKVTNGRNSLRIRPLITYCTLQPCLVVPGLHTE
ncbi:hypothetical protein LIER_34249 [Lithospermum erythrorhizon]|uniref:Uncharacterized protein n=1 Tax=Lithospermum erythrorhizon TaxID=34254 RepID=A0AAV3S3E2_LITER